MSDQSIIGLADIFVALLVALAIVALVSRRFAVPYTVALVVFGLLVSIAAPHLDIVLTPELVLAILVPALVFEAALRMDANALRSNLPGVTLLAVPGVVIVAALTAVVLHVMAGLSFESAFLVGAMVSATDPMAVIATMRRVYVPARLANLVEAESLFNDGTGVVLFTIAIGGGDLVSHGVPSFFVIFVLSTAVGAVLGGAAAWVAGRLHDVNLELTLTLICAYGTYLAAEAVGQSGIIATVVAGIVLGNLGRASIPVRGRVAIDTVWSYLAFLVTALVFLLIGLTITPSELVAAAGLIAAAVLAVLLGRAVVVYGLFLGIGRLPRSDRLGLRLPIEWMHVLFWSGLRGAIAVALALSLPTSRPDRELLQSIVFGVVLFTLLVQASTAGPVLRLAGAAASPGPHPQGSPPS